MSNPWGTGTWGTGFWGGVQITEPIVPGGVALNPEDIAGGFTVDDLGNAALPPIDMKAIAFDADGRLGIA